MIRQFFVSCHPSAPSKFWKNDFLPKTTIVSSAQKGYKLTWILCLLLVWMSHRTIEEGYLKIMFKWWKGSAWNPSPNLCPLNVAIWGYMSNESPLWTKWSRKWMFLEKGTRWQKKWKCKTLWPLFCGWGSTASRLQHHYWEAVYFLPISSQKFLVLIWSTLEGWKAESTLELPSGFEHGTP